MRLAEHHGVETGGAHALQQALAALPAQFEGIARDNRILHDGSRRSSAIYSILDHEWPGVAANLTARVAAASAARSAG